MFRRILPRLTIIAAAALALPALAQQPTPYQQSERYDYKQQQPAFGYGQPSSAYYEFDRGLLNAVSGCAYRAARAKFSQVVVREIDRADSDRFEVGGRAQWNGWHSPGAAPSSALPYGYAHPAYRVSFTCTADTWGRVINWRTDRQ